ncbi:MAG: phosphate signaling complex protein PhoU [Nitratireductor sp.]|nr:phosphate signaling complex protein PhoU [Nitratireductor sp.]
MEPSHIVRSFDEELGQIESLLLEMGGLVETGIAESVEALTNADAELCEKVIREDKKVDALEMRIDQMAVQLLARRQPMADDLRTVVCALRISSNLERIGDYAKNIAKRGKVLGGQARVGSSVNTLKRMAKMVRAMVGDVLDAFVARDTAMADELRLRDEEVDHMHNTLFRELLTHMMEDPRNITPCMHLLFIAKNLERMGDHVTGIAEQISYLVNGVMPVDDRPKSDLVETIARNPIMPVK